MVLVYPKNVMESCVSCEKIMNEWEKNYECTSFFYIKIKSVKLILQKGVNVCYNKYVFENRIKIIDLYRR